MALPHGSHSPTLQSVRYQVGRSSLRAIALRQLGSYDDQWLGRFADTRWLRHLRVVSPLDAIPDGGHPVAKNYIDAIPAGVRGLGEGPWIGIRRWAGVGAYSRRIQQTQESAAPLAHLVH